MTDLTSVLSSILVDKHSQKPLSRKTGQLKQSLDTFLNEAYQINRNITSLLLYLRAIRQPYLSTAPPPPRRNKNSTQASTKHAPPYGDIPTYLTDPQREDIDSNTSLLLNDINRNIANLSSASKLQNDTATRILEKKYGKPSGFLFRWAAGDGTDEDAGKGEQQLREEAEVKTRYACRESIVWYLNHGLREAVGLQQGMVEVRLERERERRESVLWDARNKTFSMNSLQQLGGSRDQSGFDRDEVNQYAGDMRATDTYNPTLDGTSTTTGEGLEGLTEEQLQLFEQENSSLLNHYNETLAKVTQAEKSLVEISSLQQTLIGHLSVQGEMVEQLVEDASKTDENVKRGNKELKKASERGSVARGVFFGTIGLCTFLVVWDLVF